MKGAGVAGDSGTELAAWLILTGTPGLGREAARRLLAAFGSAPAVIGAARTAQRAVAGQAAAEALEQADPAAQAERLAQTQAWLADIADAPRALITLGDPQYPSALLQTADPPLMLYAQGRLTLLHAPNLAIVGSRHATAQGLDTARDFARHLSAAGVTVVSGLAQGIDGAAHEGALDGAGSTVAVVGTGLDRVYPRQHQALGRRIAAAGLIVGELPLGAPSLPIHFPMRNRIIAGLSRGTLVVEAATQSGSLITARLAAEAGRDVFAIPGSIHSPQSRGCHALIKQGAKLVESADDILSELPDLVRAAPTAARNASTPDDAQAPADTLLDALGFDPVTIDALAARTGWPMPQLSSHLLNLELEGRIARLPGGLYQRRSAA